MSKNHAKRAGKVQVRERMPSERLPGEPSCKHSKYKTCNYVHLLYTVQSYLDNY